MQNEIEKAVEMAINECIKEGILEDTLRNNREEVRSMLLTEYDEQAHIKNEKEISFEEGEEMLSKLIQCLLAEKRVEDINRVTVDVEYRRRLYREFELR